MNNVKYKSICE